MYHSGGPMRPVSTPPTTRRREGTINDGSDYGNHAYEYLLEPANRKRSRSRGRSLSRDPPMAPNWTHGGHAGHDHHKRRHTSPTQAPRGRGPRMTESRRLDDQFSAAKDTAYKRGWSACFDKYKKTINDAETNQEEVYRLREQIRSVHGELQEARAAIQHEERRTREAERVANAAQLRLKARKTRRIPHASAYDADIVMGDAAPPGRTSRDSAHAPPYSQAKGYYNPQPGIAEVAAHTYTDPDRTKHALTRDSTAASNQKGEEPADNMTRAPSNANVKKITPNAWTKAYKPKAVPITDQFVMVPRYDHVPESFEELERIHRKALAPHGAIAVYQLIQWKQTAMEKKGYGFALAAPDRWLQQWEVPLWFVDQHDELRGSLDCHVMTPPTWHHPLIHWFRHYDANRTSMRKGFRRHPDGRPDLPSIEGLYLAALLALDEFSERIGPDMAVVNTLAGLLVSPAAYEATLARLQLEPGLDLHILPYDGPRPASADALCRHLAMCGLTPWDVRQSLSEWAAAYLASNGKSNRTSVETPTPSPVVTSSPTSASTLDVNTPATEPANMSALQGTTTVEPSNVPLPDGDDMDLDEIASPGDDDSHSAPLSGVITCNYTCYRFVRV
ncbi:hypothetical protein C2E23DRAFT_858503 [Lenzites betulinus]|nr:hypothetical protein C2E23DRAFT_858503 [Lenzites betulinus]